MRMNLNEMIKGSFPSFTLEDWKVKSEESLKGKSLDVLTKDTYEHIKMKPLYSKADQMKSISQYPGLSDFRRGKDPLGYVQKGWIIAQKIQAKNMSELGEKLDLALKSGQFAISFEINEELSKSMTGMFEPYYEQFPFSLNAKRHQLALLENLMQVKNPLMVSGYIGTDPIAILAETGVMPNGQDEEYSFWAKTIKLADKNLPNLKTILIDTTPYHNGGANAVQELAISLSTGVFHLEHLANSDVSVDQILEKMIFQYSVGANFFMEIAKLRASRILWSKICGAYGVTEEKRGMVISANTSFITKTIYDPYVNILRSGSEAFAAVLGGVQYLHVSPFTEPGRFTNEFSERIARNSQLILKEETLVSKVIDPAGGSWYIESLTNQLAEKAWEWFLKIEDRNGILEVLKTGWLQKEILQVKEARQKDIFTRKQTIVGTNMYANLKDQPLQSEKVEKPSQNERTVLSITPISGSRLSQPFEELRKRTEQVEEKGGSATVGLLCLGSLSQNKVRTDFITGFLAAGGIHAHPSEAIYSTDQAVSFIKESNYKHYCLCGSNEQYLEQGVDLVKAIKNEFPNINLYMAGLPKDTDKNEWVKRGISDYLHANTNCYQTLSSLLKKMEVESNA